MSNDKLKIYVTSKDDSSKRISLSPIEELSKDSDRMSYLNPQEALDYGVIDRILTSQKDLPNKI